MPGGDFTAIDFKPSDLNISGQASGDLLFFDGSNWVAKGGTDETVHAGSTTYDLTTASGTQAITGTGFKPTLLSPKNGYSLLLNQQLGFICPKIK